MGGLFGVVSAGCSFLFASALGGATHLLYGIGAAIAVAGVLTAAIYSMKRKSELESARGALEVARAAAGSWKDERDAEKSKAERLEMELRDEISARKDAERRTDLSSVERLLVEQHRESLDLLAAMNDTLRASTAALQVIASRQPA